MEIMRLRLLFFALFFLLLFGGAAQAFTHNFNALIKSQELTTLVNQGQTYHLSIAVKSNQASQVAYPVAFALTDGSYSRVNTWVTFNDNYLDINNLSETTLNFDLTVPVDTPVGEYIRAVGVSDLFFVDGESENPPTAIAIPITIQVTEVEVIPTVTPTPTPRVTTDDQSSSSLPSVALLVTSAPTPQPKAQNPAAAKQTWLKIPEQAASDDLFSQLQVLNFTSVYDPIKQQQVFRLHIKNTGNISSVPLGFINITNAAQKVVATIDINPKQLPVKPNATSEFLVNFSSQDFFLGELSAELNFGFVNTRQIKEPTLIGRLDLVYLGQFALLIIILTTAMVVLIFLLQPFGRHKFIRYSLVMIFICISIGLLSYFYSLSVKAPENFLGANDLDLHASVSQQLIMKTIITNTGDQQIEIAGNNSLGVIIWSLQNESRIQLEEIVDHSAIVNTFLLSGVVKRFPILILTRGY